ncbi:Cell division topological specificity factor-like, chloroplastic [Cucurbita argyrosperma subsp. argyrosperma]|uniref:Cell division topological specificity factor homolog, chloroplastic n=2 Tax=Cucurbita TaxID=3660 RepID=A0A6J1GJ70_CUCMO
MAVSGDLRVSATLCSHHPHPLRTSFRSSKVEFSGFSRGGPCIQEVALKWRNMAIDSRNRRGVSHITTGSSGSYELSSKTSSQEAETFLMNAINMNFFERLNLAWRILFPTPASKRNSNALIAKQRLKMILFADRCAVSDEAKRKIVSNIVRALSDFVEIESKDKVELSMSADADLGTIYSVTVPVRRVKKEYQEEDESGTITNIEYKDKGETSGSVDVRFDFFIPD